MEQKPFIRLRAHHGMCLFFFRGKGYSSDFTSHMAHVKELLEENPDQEILLCASEDEICSRCPHRKAQGCESAEKTERYDREVLAVCSLSGRTTYSAFKEAVETHILRAGRREEICGDCQWSEICR